MTLNYTLQDAACTFASIPVFAIFLFAPGFGFGLATNVLDFRRRSTTEKALLSVPFSIVISTILANILGRYVAAPVLMAVFVLSALCATIYLAAQWLTRRRLAPFEICITTKIAIALAILWAFIVLASLIDIQVGGRLYVSTALWDHAVRAAFVRSALRSGPPPTNPFCYLGSAPTARYYYYWYVLCSYPARLSHLDARYVLYGSSVWAGFSLAALIPIYLKNFTETRDNLRRKAVLGILLLSVTGLDIVPTAYEFLRSKSIPEDMEWWDPVQVTSWIDALLWVPHHVAALVACLIGFLALWWVRKKKRQAEVALTPRIVAGIFAALAFAAAAGLSVYVTFTFAIFLALWSLRLLYKQAFSDFLLYSSSGCLTVLISVPYLRDLLASGSVGGAPGAASTRFENFGLRALPGFLSTPYFLKERGFSHPSLLLPFGLPMVYFLEFGLFAIVAWSRLRQDIRNRAKLDEPEIASWYLVVISLLVITFVKSSVISNNDLAFRSAMITQFVLLIWGAVYLDGWMFSETKNKINSFSIRNVAILSTLSLGLLGTAYGITILRTYTLLDDHGMVAYPATWLPSPPNIGADLFDTRQAYQKLDHLLPLKSIVQYNPMTPDYLPLLIYSKFQSVDAFPDCGTEFGGDVIKCLPVQAVIADLFNKPGTYDIHALCRRLSIDTLVARKSDPAWKDANSWVWRDQPVIHNGYIRMFRCN